MKKITIYISVFMMLLAGISCSSEASLQKYYIDNQSNKNFRSFDVPANVLKFKQDLPPEAEEAIASLKKFNVLAFKRDDTNQEAYIIEKKKVKTILKNPKFKELIRIKDKEMSFVIKYEGSDSVMDEVIVYASDKTKGFALVRVLGDNMEPAKIMKLATSIQSIDSDQLKDLGGLFKE